MPQRRHRHADCRSACGGDRVSDLGRGRPVSLFWRSAWRRAVLGAALLCTTSNRETGIDRVPGAGFLSRDALANESAAVYPELYLFSSFIAIASAILLFVLLRTVLPTSDALRRHWYLKSAQAEIRALLSGGCSRRLDDEALFRDADRIGQLAALQPAPGDARRMAAAPACASGRRRSGASSSCRPRRAAGRRSR